MTDVLDLALVTALYGQTVPPGTPEDINQDGKVDIFDLVIVGMDYGCGTNQILFSLEANPKIQVFVIPSSPVLKAGDTLTVQVVAEGVEDISGFQLSLAYDADLLSLQTAAEGGFLSNNGEANLFTAGAQIQPGLLASQAFVRADMGTVSGSGILLEAVFKTLSAGQATVQAESILLVGPEITGIPVAAGGTTVEIK